MTPRIGEDFVNWQLAGRETERWAWSISRSSRTSTTRTCPANTMATAEQWAAGLSGPAYAIDDETAIKVVDGTVEVVSEGHWKLFTPRAAATLVGSKGADDAASD